MLSSVDVSKLLTAIVSTLASVKFERVCAVVFVPEIETFKVSIPRPPSTVSPAWAVVPLDASEFVPIAAPIVSLPEPPTTSSVAVVRLVTVFSKDELLEIKAEIEPITALDESKTETLMPSRPSAVESEVAAIVKVAVEDPDAITTLPDSESVSPAVALSTVAPLVSPATLYVNVVSEDTAAFAVIVYVIDPPSATLFVSAERA